MKTPPGRGGPSRSKQRSPIAALNPTVFDIALSSGEPNATSDVNPFGGKLTLLVEPRLPADTWYVFADTARLAAMQYAYLSSAQGVQIQRTEAWDTLGMQEPGESLAPAPSPCLASWVT